MKNIFMSMFMTFLFSVNIFAENLNDTIKSYSLDEVSVTSLYRNNVTTGSILDATALKATNHGQGPDYVFSTLPNIYAYNDNGTHMGYTYFRIRGMGQERMNVTLDGMPWNESEDFGCYFSNSPDLMGSMHTIKVERGASITNNGTAAYAGNVSLESMDLEKDIDSYAEISAGSFKSFRQSAVYNMGRKGHWGLHIRATNQQTDGFKENCYNNSQAFTTKVGYWFNDNHYLDFMTMTGYHRNGQGYQGVTWDMLPKNPTPFKQTLSGNRQQETDDFLTTYNRLQYKGKFNDKTFFTSTLYWQHQNGNYRIGWDDETVPTGKVLNNYHLNYNMYGVNAILKYYAKDNLSFTGGVNTSLYYRYHKGFDIPSDTIINAWHDKGTYTPYYSNRGFKPDVNVFAGTTWSPFDKFHVDVNIQYRHTGLKYTVYTPAYGDVVNDVDYSHNWDFFNYSTGLTYDINNTSKVYARYVVTNREPSRTDLFCNEYRVKDSEMNTASERVNDVEIGYELKNNFISFNANIFYMNFSDELVATGELSSTNFLPLHKQYDSYRTGIELSTDIQPIKDLHFLVNAAWSENKVQTDEYKTNHTFSPGATLFGEVNYLFNNKVKVGINTQYHSEMYMNLANTSKLPELFTMGAYVNARLNKTVELGLVCDNITNRLNVSNGSYDSVLDQSYYLIDAPFTFMATAKFHF